MSDRPVRRELPSDSYRGPRRELPRGRELDIRARGTAGNLLPAGLGLTRGGAARSAPGGAPGGPLGRLGGLVKTAAIPPYWLDKPPEGIDYYFNVEGVLAAGAGSTVILVGTPATLIQVNYEAVVASVNIFVDAPTTALGAVWTLRFNESPVSGWDTLRTFARAANNLSIEFSGNVQVPGGTKIDVLVSNTNAGGPWTVGVEVTGWAWPRLARIRAFGEGD